MAETSQGRILLVDDHLHWRRSLRDLFCGHGYECTAAAGPEEALGTLREFEFDFLLTDLAIPGMSGIELLREAHKIDPHLIGIVMTEQASIQSAIDSLKNGAFDYILKPPQIATMLPTLERAREVRRLRQENLQLRDTVGLFDLLKAITATLDVDKLLDFIADAAAEQCEADEVSIMLPTQRGDSLCVCAVRGPRREALIGTRVPMEVGIAAWVAREREALILNGSVHDQRFSPAQPRKDIRCAASLPMLAGGKLVGVLNVNVTRRYRPFSAGQMKALQFIANTGATALDRALLFQQAQEAEAKYRSIFENAAEGIFQISLSGRLISANPALARMLGYASSQELLDHIPDVSQHFFADPESRQEFAELLQDQSLQHRFEARMQRKDRTTIWVLMSLRVARRDTGMLLHYEGTVEDITDRKKLEADFLQSQKMEAIGRLAGGLAHDFNNLLTVINGYSELLRLLLPGEGLPRTYLDEIYKAGQRGASLAKQLLSFSRKQVLMPQIMDVNAHLKETEKLLRRLIGENIVLEVSPARPLPPIKADPTQIDQILVNLAVNARDALPQGGKVRIETSQTEIGALQASDTPGLSPGTFVVLTFQDNGVGIARELQDKIFEPFFTTKAPGKGTGLGLATVYSIVQQNGGFIRLDSDVGRGTSFQIFLPRAKESPSALGVKADSDPDSTLPLKGTILLVEDDEGVRWLAKCVLEARGLVVLDAGSGEEALAISSAHAGAIDLVVTDMIMPGMTGRHLADYLTSISPRTRILFISGYIDETLNQQGFVEGGYPFLQKPFTPDTLVRYVRKALRSHV